MIELPLRHASLFAAIGAEARSGGIILAGPPGTGKTLLARAVARECGAHIEVVSGPEILSPWVGGSEQALRAVFERARARVPAVVLFDELDSLAPARSAAGAHHQQALVGQLLTLLDGLEARAGISVLATTNRPASIDPALRRPGRFDRVVWMRLPDKRGRVAILKHHLGKLRLAPGLDLAEAAERLATRTRGMSGATLAFLAQTAARACVREAIAQGRPPEHMAVTAAHLDSALRSVLEGA